MNMFNEEEVKKHIVPEIKMRDNLKALQPLEEYFIKRCGELGIEYSYDCTANERTYFKTLNYTNYAGMFIMHPLCFSSSVFQMYDAKADHAEGVGHLEWLKNQRRNKYTQADGSEFKKYEGPAPAALVVCLGDNAFKKYTDPNKLRSIYERYNGNVLFKLHPNDGGKVKADIVGLLPDAKFVDPLVDLYSILPKAGDVFASHCSEVILFTYIYGNYLEPTDHFDIRLTGSFSHINNILLTHRCPMEGIESIFASPKSGIVHPDVDKDWKKKIDDYLDYIMEQRELERDFYV